MAIFEEKTPRFYFALLAPLLALLLSFPLWHLDERQLFWNEGDVATSVTEFQGILPVVTFHGQATNELYPLYPLLVSLVNHCGGSMEFSLRFISVLSLAGLVLIIWVTCYRAMGIQAAAAGAAMMLSTILVAEKAVEGYPHMLTVLILYSGWLLWFNMGQGRGNWDLAWLFAGLFGGLAFYSGGFIALTYFFVPLAFQRRPLTVWPKLRRWSFAVAMLIVLIFIILWGIPYWYMDLRSPLNPGEAVRSLQVFEYFTDILKFPFECMLRLLPWTLMLWAPFCPAILPLDENPLFTKFHRILFYVLFVLICLNPATKGRDILYLVPLLSTLLGLNYWIVVRRYGNKFLLLFLLGSIVTTLLSIAAIIYLFLPPEMLRSIPLERTIEYRQALPYRIPAVIQCSGALLLSLIAMVLCRRKHSAVWLVFLLIFCSVMLLFWAVINPYRATDRSKGELGLSMKEALEKENLPPGTVLYKDASIGGLYAECYYTGMPVRSMDPVKNPTDEGCIYVISPSIPVQRNRTWTKLFDTSYKERRLYIWKGVKNEDDYDDEYDESGE